MIPNPRRLLAALAISALCVVCSIAAAAQPARGSARGEVTDNSGGVLPGVTVVATAPGGDVLATAVTDAAGRYAFASLPAGTVTLTFQLEGFESAAAILTVAPGVESRLPQRLQVAPYAETVNVKAPLIDAAPRPMPLPPPPVVKPVPAHDRDSICGPSKPGATRDSLGTIRSSRYQNEGVLYTKGAELVIDGGLLDGLAVGENLVVRRYYQVWGAARADAVGEHSAGLLQIVAAGERSSVAVVVYACDELRQGDFLATFNPEPIHPSDPQGTPAYRDAARILFADEGQTLGVPRRMMVIDRGSARGIRVGQRVTLFRQGFGSNKHDIVGDAVVVAVRADSATIKIERVTDAVEAGDFAAPQVGSSVRQ